MKTQTAPVKIFIVDDFAPFRDAFRSMLQNQPGMQVIGEAANGSDLLQQIKNDLPDIILCDIRMPVMDGIEATRIITKEYPQVFTIALSIHNDDYTIMEMLAAGARGYILKATTNEELTRAINTVYNNSTYYCNSTRSKLAQLVANKVFDPVTKEFAIHLTEREKEILRLICKEMSNYQIALQLNISERTVEGFRSKMLSKTKVNNLAGLVVFAIKYGIYDPG